MATVDKILRLHQKVQALPLVFVRRVLTTIARVYHNVVATDGKYRKLWNVAMEIPEVILQILSLRNYMMQGLDSSLLFFYAALMALNAFIAFYHVQFRWNDDTLHHILKDSIVDAVFAVFFPALILVYSLSVFQDDLKTVKIRQQFFPPRIFERKARNFVSAKELNMFSTDFESLLTRTTWDVFLKLSFSLLACFRWSRITHLLLQREQQRRSSPHAEKHTTQNHSSACMVFFEKKSIKAVAPLGAPEVFLQQDSIVAHEQPIYRRLRRMVGFFFLIYGIGCIIYTAIAVRVSRSACLAYPQCVQFAYLWIPGASHSACQCLSYVDRDLAPANSDDLMDVTQTFTDLAGAGKLQTVQLINRLINGSLPDELRTCTGLRNLVLIHTGVEVFPPWTSTTFSDVEYLHIEGDTSNMNLVELPIDLFHAMSNLHTIHLSYHSSLSNLPSLLGLPALESVYFGYLDSVKEFPPTANLSSIQVIALEEIPQVRSLPEIASYEDTLELVFVQNMAICCSGFLSEGICNTTFPSCCGSGSQTDVPFQDHSDGDGSKSSLPPTCLHMPDDSAFLPSNETITLLDQFAANFSSFCDADQATCPNSVSVSGSSKIKDVCAGVLYRECTSDAEGVGICFNEDMGRVLCMHSQLNVDMRKAEIAAGCRCDKVEERWLGCT